MGEITGAPIDPKGSAVDGSSGVIKGSFRWYYAALVAVMVVLIGAAAFFGIRKHREHLRAQRELSARWERWLALKSSLEYEIRGFKGVSGIVVKDLSMNWEFTYKSGEHFPAASLLKLPIMLALFEASEEGKLGLNDRFRLTERCKTSGSGVLKGQPAGSEYTVDELISLMISKSDNTATNVLIEMLDFPYFNSWFRSFGLLSTNLSRKMMDFRHRKDGVENYTSAKDISYALEKLYRREFLNTSLSEKGLGLLKKQHVKDRIPRELPQEAVVAHKTGLERRICHDAGIVYTPNGDFLLCVLTKNAPSSRQAKQFIASLASRVYEFYDP